MAKYLISGISSGVGFLIIYFLGKNIIVALAAGFIMYVVMSLLTRSSKKEIAFSEELQSAKEIESYLANGKKTLTNISKYGSVIKNKSVSQNAREIYEVGIKIVGYLSENKDNIKEARNFFDYYLPKITDMLYKYLKIEENKLKDENSVNFMLKVEKLIGEIKNAFENLLANLYKDDIMDITADMSVMEATLKSEGLLDDNFFNLK